MRSALSSKVLEENVVVLESLSFEKPKTKQMVQTLDNLNIDSNTLIVTAHGDDNTARSARNIPGVKALRADFINVYDLLKYDTLLITKDAVAMVEEVFA
jgi:large subunit ribosomal protein L4